VAKTMGLAQMETRTTTHPRSSGSFRSINLLFKITLIVLMEKIKVVLTIFERIFFMFLQGEKFNDIRSMTFIDYANYLHDKKNIEKAIEYYNKALRLNPTNYYAYGGLAGAFTEKRLFKEALEYCNKAISIKKDILMYVLLVIIYESLEEPTLAKEALQKALKFFDNNLAAAYDRLAYSYFQLGMYKKAEYYLLEAIKVNPNEAGLHYNLAKIYLAQEKFQEAKGKFQRVLELTSDKRYKKYAIENIKHINHKKIYG
jgi:tetratricopeptide (TPR) repeat protein